MSTIDRFHFSSALKGGHIRKTLMFPERPLELFMIAAKNDRYDSVTWNFPSELFRPDSIVSPGRSLLSLENFLQSTSQVLPIDLLEPS